MKGEKMTRTQRWQKALNEHGFPCGKVDGVLGPKTLAAIEACKKVQKWLNANGFPCGKVDGWPGMAFVSAMKNFQQAAKNKGYYPGRVDGVYGPLTAAAMKKWSLPQPEPRKPINPNPAVYFGIGASSQEFNVIDGWNEAHGCREIQDLVVNALRKMGFKVWSAPKAPGKTDEQNQFARRERAMEANRMGVTHYIEFHTDAAGNPPGYTGMMGVYYSSKGKEIADTITTYAAGVLGVPKKGPRYDRFDVLTITRMPACIIEVLNHEDPDDRALLKNPAWRQQAAQVLARGIAKLG